MREKWVCAIVNKMCIWINDVWFWYRWRACRIDVTNALRFFYNNIYCNVVLQNQANSWQARNTHPVVRCGAFGSYDAIIFGVVLLNYFMLLFLVTCWNNNVSERFIAKMASEISWHIISILFLVSCVWKSTQSYTVKPFQTDV